MTTKETVHRLVDELPEAVLPVVERYLTTIHQDPLIHVLANAPIEDEELTLEERAALAAAWERYEHGTSNYIAGEQLRREIGW
jgi:hypothetical protein